MPLTPRALVGFHILWLASMACSGYGINFHAFVSKVSQALFFWDGTCLTLECTMVMNVR
jgi:hypothetical protein